MFTRKRNLDGAKRTISRDGRYVAAYTLSGVVHVWDLSCLRRHLFRAHSDFEEAVAVGRSTIYVERARKFSKAC